MRLLSPALVVLVAFPLQAQEKVALTRPDAEFPEPFSQVRGLREMADGRVMISDPTDKVVQILDFRNGAATGIGREGQGPGEFALPFGLWPMPDGGTLLHDMGRLGFHAIDPAGKLGQLHSPPQSTPQGGQGGRGVRMMGGGAIMGARGVDARGRVYYQGPSFSMDAAQTDSVPIMRWDLATSRVDTLTWKPIPVAARPQVTRGAGGATVAVRVGGAPWPAEAQWGVAADGRIALVSPGPYQVKWINPSGGAQTGPAVPYTPIRVTDAEKKAFMEARSRARPTVAAFGGPAGGAARSMNVTPPAEEPAWPEVMPPFTGTDAVLVTPEGEVWVARTRAANDRTPRYDVFDGAGRRVREVTLRPRSRVVGFGRGAVYVVRMDEDDLQYLERYRR